MSTVSKRLGDRLREVLRSLREQAEKDNSRSWAQGIEHAVDRIENEALRCPCCSQRLPD